MAFQLMPSETILHIFELLYDERDLAGLSRSCRRFHELVEARLYSHFTEHNVNGLPRFLRTIVNNPSLARHVKILWLFERDPQKDRKTIDFVYDPSNYGHWANLRSTLEAYFSDCILLRYTGELAAGKPIAADLMAIHVDRMNECYSWDMLAANLILMVHNVESLSVIRFDDETRTILSVLHTASNLQRYLDSAFGLPALNEISLGSWDHDEEPRLGIDDIVPLLEMPSVKYFDCDGISDAEMIGNFSSDSSLVSLTLDKCGLPVNELERIVENCGQLEQFAVSYNWCDEASGFGPSSLFHALLNSQDHLRSLSIVDEHDWWALGGVYPSTDTEPMPCLTGFTQLIHLEISCQALIDKKILVSATDNKKAGLDGHFGIPTKQFAFNDLPVSLVDLTIQNARPSIVNLLESFRLESTSLKTIHVNFGEQQEGTVEVKDWRSVYKKYRERGIMISFNFHGHIMDEELFTY